MSIMDTIPGTYVEGFHDLQAVRLMEYRQLGKTGLNVSKLSYGVSSIGSVFRETNDEEAYNVVEHALKSGINWIDAAPWYGHGKGEAVFGQAVVKKNLPRQSYYLSTKVGRYAPDRKYMFDFSAERTLLSVDESLQRLNADYVDVIQVHDMEFAPSLDIIINETLPALQKVKDAGKARFIGITGYPLENFVEVIKRSPVQIDTIMTYCRYCLNDTGLLDILPFLQSRGIGILSASATGMGLLTNRGPPKWHPSSEKCKKACAQAASYCMANDVSISKLAINFTSGNPDVHTAMMSTASLSNLKENLLAATAPLAVKEQEVLDKIRNDYMIPLNNDNWGWNQVEEFKRKLKMEDDQAS